MVIHIFSDMATGFEWRAVRGSETAFYDPFGFITMKPLFFENLIFFLFSF